MRLALCGTVVLGVLPVVGCAGGASGVGDVGTLDWERLQDEPGYRSVTTDWRWTGSDAFPMSPTVLGDMIRVGDTIYIASPGTRDVVMLSWVDGRPLGRLGQSADPSDGIRTVSGLILTNGGEIVLYDGAQGRIFVFGSSRELLRTATVRLPPGYILARLVGVGASGELFFLGMRAPGAPSVGRRTETSAFLAAFPDDRREGRVIAELAGPERYYRELEDRVVADPLLFGKADFGAATRASLWRVDERGLWIVDPESGTAEERVAFRWSPVPVTDEEWDLARRVSLARISDPVLRERRRDLMDRIPRLPTVPLIEFAAGFGSDQVWLRREPAPSWEVTDWAGFDGSGRPVGAVRLPVAWVIRWADSDGWVAATVEDGDPVILKGGWR